MDVPAAAVSGECGQRHSDRRGASLQVPYLIPSPFLNIHRDDPELNARLLLLTRAIFLAFFLFTVGTALLTVGFLVLFGHIDVGTPHEPCTHSIDAHTLPYFLLAFWFCSRVIRTQLLTAPFERSMFVCGLAPPPQCSILVVCHPTISPSPGRSRGNPSDGNPSHGPASGAGYWWPGRTWGEQASSFLVLGFISFIPGC